MDDDFMPALPSEELGEAVSSENLSSVSGDDFDDAYDRNIQAQDAELEEQEIRDNRIAEDTANGISEEESDHLSNTPPELPPSLAQQFGWENSDDGGDGEEAPRETGSRTSTRQVEARDEELPTENDSLKREIEAEVSLQVNSEFAESADEFAFDKGFDSGQEYVNALQNHASQQVVEYAETNPEFSIIAENAKSIITDTIATNLMRDGVDPLSAHRQSVKKWESLLWQEMHRSAEKGTNIGAVLNRKLGAFLAKAGGGESHATRSGAGRGRGISESERISKIKDPDEFSESYNEQARIMAGEQADWLP